MADKISKNQIHRMLVIMSIGRHNAITALMLNATFGIFFSKSINVIMLNAKMRTNSQFNPILYRGRHALIRPVGHLLIFHAFSYGFNREKFSDQWYPYYMIHIISNFYPSIQRLVQINNFSFKFRYFHSFILLKPHICGTTYM